MTTKVKLVYALIGWSLFMNGYTVWISSRAMDLPHGHPPLPWGFEEYVWPEVRGGDIMNGGFIEHNGRVICHAKRGQPVVFACPDLRQRIDHDNCVKGSWQIYGWSFRSGSKAPGIRFDLEGGCSKSDI